MKISHSYKYYYFLHLRAIMQLQLLRDFLSECSEGEYAIESHTIQLPKSSDITSDGLKFCETKYDTTAKYNYKLCDCYSGLNFTSLTTELHNYKNIEFCGKSYCLVPHVLVYKLKKASWRTPTRSEGEDVYGEHQIKKGISDVTADMILSLEDKWNDDL